MSSFRDYKKLIHINSQKETKKYTAYILVYFCVAKRTCLWETSNLYFLLDPGSTQQNMPSLVISACDYPRLQVFRFLLFCWLCAFHLHIISMGLQFPFTTGSTIFSITVANSTKEPKKITYAHFFLLHMLFLFPKGQIWTMFTADSSKSSWSNPLIFFPLLVWFLLTLISLVPNAGNYNHFKSFHLICLFDLLIYSFI